MELTGTLNGLVLATALGAGLVSFISPCVLPLVPAYLSFITGLSAEELKEAHGQQRLSAFGQSVSFVLGLAVIFAVLGASATTLGLTLLQNQPILLKAAGVMVVVFGLHMLGLFRIPALSRTVRVADMSRFTQRGYVGSFLMGLAFGAGWTPCIGPFLGGILTLAAAEATVAQGTLLLLLYALGLGLPFLVAGLAVERALGVMRAIRPHLGTVEKVSGVMLVGMGVLLFTDQFTLLTRWLTEVFGIGLAF